MLSVNGFLCFSEWTPVILMVNLNAETAEDPREIKGANDERIALISDDRSQKIRDNQRERREQ